LVAARRDDNENGVDAGSAFVFRFDGSSWNQEAKLIANDGEADDLFATSISISVDVAIVGVPYDSNENGTNAGSAYIFRFDGSNWNQEAKLLASDGQANDYFGISVSVDEGAAVVGSRLDDDNGTDSGSAYVFRFNGTNWNQEAKLLADDGAANDLFGTSISISIDVAIVGAVYDDDKGTNSGSAYIFRFDGTNWNQQAKLLAADGAADDTFGGGVSLDGDMAIVGVRFDDDKGENSGSAYIFAGLGDCNENGPADICDIADGTSEDCQPNGVPDECDIADGSSMDANENGIPDECEGCTGRERVKPKCKQLNNGINKLTVKLTKSRPGDNFSVELSTGDVKNGIIMTNGKAKVRFKRLPSGGGTAKATWGCGAVQVRNYSCS